MQSTEAPVQPAEVQEDKGAGREEREAMRSATCMQRTNVSPSDWCKRPAGHTGGCIGSHSLGALKK